jgi:hypothetical protein
VKVKQLCVKEMSVCILFGSYVGLGVAHVSCRGQTGVICVG